MRKNFQLSVFASAWFCTAVLCTPVLAQEGEPSLKLKPSTGLMDRLPPQIRSQLPTYVQSDFITGRTDLDTSLQGNSVLRKADTLIQADSID